MTDWTIKNFGLAGTNPVRGGNGLADQVAAHIAPAWLVGLCAILVLVVTIVQIAVGGIGTLCVRHLNLRGSSFPQSLGRLGAVGKNIFV